MDEPADALFDRIEATAARSSMDRGHRRRIRDRHDSGRLRAGGCFLLHDASHSSLAPARSPRPHCTRLCASSDDERRMGFARAMDWCAAAAPWATSGGGDLLLRHGRAMSGGGAVCCCCAMDSVVRTRSLSRSKEGGEERVTAGGIGEVEVLDC